jgi:hypothetical protein
LADQVEVVTAKVTNLGTGPVTLREFGLMRASKPRRGKPQTATAWSVWCDPSRVLLPGEQVRRDELSPHVQTSAGRDLPLYVFARGIERKTLRKANKKPGWIELSQPVAAVDARPGSPTVGQDILY